MRKIRILLIFSLLIIFPTIAYADSKELNITCDSSGLYKTKDTNCTLSGNTDEIITGVEGVLSFSEDIQISNFALTSNWLNITAVSTITSGMSIEAIASAEDGAEDITGEFTVATFKVRLKEEATSTSQEITFSSIKFYDENVNTINIEKVASVQFQDFLELENYTVDDEKNIIYRLNPMTIGTFKSNIRTNLTYGIYNSDDIQLNDTDALKTGYHFKVTFMNNPRNYTLSVLGDVLSEGHPTLDGARTIARHIIDNNVLTTDEVLLAADYNNDNNIKMNDVLKMIIDMEN